MSRNYNNNNVPNVGNGDFSNDFTTNPDSYVYVPVNESRKGEFYNKNTRINTEEENKRRYDQNNYVNNFSQDFNKQLSLTQEPDIQYQKRNNYLTINSKDRDITTYSSSSKFVINLDSEYKNITSIELITAIIPDKNNVINEPYLLLNIKELDTLMDSPGKELSESFAMLQLAPPTSPGTFIQIDKRTFENTVLNFHTPKSSLSKLTISITDSEGVLFSFGGNGTSTKAYQTIFTFKITTLDTDRSTLNQRNVY